MRKFIKCSISLTLLLLYLSGCSALAPIATDVLTNDAPSLSAQVGEEANKQIVGNQEKIDVGDVEGDNVIDQKKQMANDINANEVNMITLPTWLVIVALFFAWFPNYNTFIRSIKELRNGKETLVSEET